MAGNYKRFYQTDIWQEAYNLQKEVFEITASFPSDERYGLGSQLNKSANSVVANTAEAHGRFFYADKVRVLYIVRGEIEETQSHLIVAAGRVYLDREKCKKLVGQYERLKMKINGNISNYITKKEQEK